ncbi:MAG: Putative capsular polysaccharide related hexapeptide transferase family protein, partial [Bacteroidetes bacterium 38_7]
MDKKIILVGGFHEIIELCENLGYTIIGIIDNNIKDSYLNYPILGTDDEANTLFMKYGSIPLVITPDLPIIREKLFKHYSDIGFSFETIISSHAKISKSSS